MQIKIRRIKCKECGVTSALFLPTIVPYSSISFFDHVKCIEAYESNSTYNEIIEENPELEYAVIHSLIKQYKKYWKERLLSENILLTSNIINIVCSCINIFEKQFMQIRRTKNFLHIVPT